MTRTHDFAMNGQTSARPTPLWMARPVGMDAAAIRAGRLARADRAVVELQATKVVKSIDNVRLTVVNLSQEG